MNSLSEFKELLISKEIEVKEFGGWYLKVGKDIWTMTHDCFYKNGIAQSLKEKGLFDNYKRKKQDDNSSIKIGVRRGIGSGRVFRNGEHD